MSALNILRVADATLHIAPAEGGYDLQVITPAGIQVVITLAGAELEAVVSEARDFLAADTLVAGSHRAGMRLATRLERIKK